MTYIKEYTSLTPQEQRQLKFKRQYKIEHPAWDDSMVLLTRLTGEHLPSQATVLDFGCGHGNFVLDELGNIFKRKVGMDVLPEATAGNTSVDEVVYASNTPFPFADNTFNVVISLWVMEHVADPKTVFAEIARVLKPGGFFAFVTPNKQSLLITIRRLLSKRTADRLLKRFYGRDDDDVFDVHYRANSLSDLRRLAEHAGLQIAFLQTNSDHSYTAFGPITYRLSVLFDRLFGNFAKPHLIGILKK